MNHPKREEWIPLLCGEADPESKQRLEAHLAACNACAQEVAGWRRSLGRLDAWKLPRASKATRSMPRQPVAWAVAAALIVTAFLAGRMTVPEFNAQELRSSLKAELSAEIQSGFARAAADSSNALANLELRLAAANSEEGEALAQEFVRVINSLREDDRAATEALFDKLQKQYTTDFVLLRRDLETLASTTDEEIESARLTLYQLASNKDP
jgi:anti-sigma factor RsiW